MQNLLGIYFLIWNVLLLYCPTAKSVKKAWRQYQLKLLTRNNKDLMKIATALYERSFEL